MTTEIHSGPLGEMRAASTAGGGTALTTAAVTIEIPDGSWHLFLMGRNYTTAVVVKLALNPFLEILKTTDSFATRALATDYSTVAQDGKVATLVALSALDTGANNNYVYIGTPLPIRGLDVVIANANVNASVMTVKYWNGSAWVTTSATDNTAAAGATLAQSGTITFTVPTAWTKAQLVTTTGPTPATSGIPHESEPLFWLQVSVSAALSATVNASKVCALNRSTAYSEWAVGQLVEQRVTKGFGGVGCIEALTDAGTANLIVNVASHVGQGFV